MARLPKIKIQIIPGVVLKERALATQFLNVNLAEGPANGPLLLLLHGFSNRWQVFQSILPILTQNWGVIAFDFRGHGKSGRALGGYTANGFYQDAEAVLDHFSANGPATLIGHSMGGSVALHLAQNYPERVRAVVTGDTSFDLSVHVEMMNSRRQTKLFGLRRKLAGRSVDELVRRGLPASQAEEMSQLDPAVIDYHAEGRVQDFFADVDNVDFDKIRCPVLLTQASPEKGGLLQNSKSRPC